MTQAPKVQGRIFLLNIRGSFLHGLWKASTPPNSTGEPAFSIQGVFPRNHPQVPELNKLIQEAATRQWKDRAPDVLRAAIANGKVCVRNGDDKQQYQGYAGNLYISARSKYGPGDGPQNIKVIDQNRQKLTEASGKLFSGCWINLCVDIFPYTRGSNGVGASLKGVQLVKPDEPWGGGVGVGAEDFGEVENTAQAAAEFGDLMGGAATTGMPSF